MEGEELWWKGMCYSGRGGAMVGRGDCSGRGGAMVEREGL